MLASIRSFTLFMLICLGLTACETLPLTKGEPAAAAPSHAFIDLDKFDRDLAASFEARLDTVEVVFYERVSPNALPQRLQKWLSTAQATGGGVRVEPPPGELRPRSPMALLSLFGSLFTVSKAYLQMKQEKVFETVSGRDATIFLVRNKADEVQVQRVVFKLKP